MPTVTAEQVVSDIRVMSSLFNNTLLSDSQIIKLYNDGGGELYDYMAMRYEQYFTLVPFDFSLPSSLGPNTIKIPVATFLKDNTCELNPATNSPQPIPRLGSWEERLQTFYAAPYGPRYWIGGDTLFMFPPNAAAGNYRLWYTPKYVPLSLLQPVPAIPNLTVSINAIGAPSTISFNNSNFTSTTVGGFVIISGATHAANNGTFTIATASGTSITTVEQTLVSESGTVGWTASYIPPGYTNAFSPIMDPWYLYPEVHASIAIRNSRIQPVDDLTPKLAALLQRVEAATSNRSEEVPQSPLREVRAYRDGYLVGYP